MSWMMVNHEQNMQAFIFNMQQVWHLKARENRTTMEPGRRQASLTLEGECRQYKRNQLSKTDYNRLYLSI